MLCHLTLLLMLAGTGWTLPKSAVKDSVLVAFSNPGSVSDKVDMRRKITRETRSISQQNMMFENAVEDLMKNHKVERREATRLVSDTLQEMINDQNVLEQEQAKVEEVCGQQLFAKTELIGSVRPEGTSSDSFIKGIKPSGFPLSSLGTCSADLSCKDSRRCEPECFCSKGFPAAGNLPELIVADPCDPKPLTCNSLYPFYSIDGTCNNLINYRWGSTNIPFRRMLFADYGPGNSPRQGSGALPNARWVSVQLHQDIDNPDPRYTHMVAQQGQFLDHDITLTPGCDQRCCKDTLDIHGESYSGDPGSCSRKECFPITVATDDPFYSARKKPVTCLDFARSSAFCFQEPREQFNAITAFIDGSNVYGSDAAKANVLRTFSNGKLKTNDNKLPIIGKAFTAGDIRAIEQPGLASMHTVWLREHNRIAATMSGSDEMLYQKSRRKVIAQMQNIIYSEWLPIILGPNEINNYTLNVNLQNTIYDPSLDPSIINSMATAAFRVGHSLLQGLVNAVSSTYELKENFFNPSIYLANMDGILQGLTQQKVQTGEEHATEHVTNFLFKESGHDFGSDLFARNIQRGRDHGLPGYLAFRDECGLPAAPSGIQPEKWAALTAVYTNINDIDLFVGGLMEDPVPGGLVGPTFACILGKQFKHLMYGDRFFFTHVGQAGQLTASEFSWVKSRRLRSVLCDNTGISKLQKEVFKVVHPTDNPLGYCKSLVADPSKPSLLVAEPFKP